MELLGVISFNSYHLDELLMFLVTEKLFLYFNECLLFFMKEQAFTVMDEIIKMYLFDQYYLTDIE
jgi:hypothetical protein